MAVFDNVQKASEAVARIIAAHILPCTLEFMDNMTINLVEDDEMCIRDSPSLFDLPPAIQ